MARTLYEGYRIGKHGGERWTGTIRRANPSGQIKKTHEMKTPRGGSIIKAVPSNGQRRTPTGDH